MKKKKTFFSALFGAIVGSLLTIATVAFALPAIYNTPSSSVFVSESDITGIVQEANSAVVAILVKQEVPVYEPIDSPLNDFFNNNPFFNFELENLQQQNGTQERVVGAGSGFLISSDGDIVTNAHVVDEEDATFYVRMNDGREFEAELVARDTVLDIAFLDIDAQQMPYLEFADSDSLKLGQGVIAIGNALAEYQNTVSTGVVSGLARSITPTDRFGRAEVLENVIQTDAAINPGNSGGPLLTLEGKVAGVNVAVARGSENIGFALPANDVKNAIESIRQHGRVIRPYIGVHFSPVNEQVQRDQNLSVDYGALIAQDGIVEGSPAQEAGLQAGDIILEVNGTRITRDATLTRQIRGYNVGDEITLKILRDNQEINISLELQEFPTENS